MKLKVTYRFHDLVENVTREVGEEFDAAPERAEKLVSRGLVQAVETVKELVKTPETAPNEAEKKPKRARKKKENN